MTGRFPGSSSQAARWVSRGSTRSQAEAMAMRYREVTVLVAICGRGTPPGRTGPARGRACGAGRLSRAGAAARAAASPGRCAVGRAGPPAGPPAARPAGSRRSRALKTTRIRRSPSRQCRAAISRVTTSRTCPAVTSVSSSSGPSRTASSTAVQDAVLVPAPRSPSTASLGSSAPAPCPARRRGEQPLGARHGAWPQPLLASAAAPAARPSRAVTGARPRPASWRCRSCRGSPRHTARRDHAGAPELATALPGS